MIRSVSSIWETIQTLRTTTIAAPNLLLGTVLFGKKSNLPCNAAVELSTDYSKNMPSNSTAPYLEKKRLNTTGMPREFSARCSRAFFSYFIVPIIFHWNCWNCSLGNNGNPFRQQWKRFFSFSRTVSSLQSVSHVGRTVVFMCLDKFLNFWNRSARVTGNSMTTVRWKIHRKSLLIVLRVMEKKNKTVNNGIVIKLWFDSDCWERFIL